MKVEQVEFVTVRKRTGVCHAGFVDDHDGNVLILHDRYGPRLPR